MLTLISLLLFTILVVSLGIHFSRWEKLREGSIVYRCTPDLKTCDSYVVTIIGVHKYLASVDRNKPYIRYDFGDYLKDIQKHRIVTDKQIDSFN